MLIAYPSMRKSFVQPGPMGVENQGIIVSMLHSAFLHTVSITWLPQGIKVSIAFGKPSNTTTLLNGDLQCPRS